MEEETSVAVAASMTEDDSSLAPPPNRPEPGGWQSAKYILGNESFEKLAAMSLVGNLTVYLQSKYNMDSIRVVNVFNVWSGSSNLTPLLGAFLSDAYLGKFDTLLYGSIASFVGMAIVTLTAGMPELRPPNCPEGSNCQQATGSQLAVLYIGLTLLAIGAGGIRPCNIAFGADQFDTRTEKGKAQLESFFNWWYFSFTMALVVALTVVVYIQTNISWVIGFGVPTVCLFLSISLFLIGKHTYIIKKAQGSIFVDMAKVVVASCRKWNVNFETSPGLSLHDPPSAIGTEEDQEPKLPHTERFKLFDKAAVIVDKQTELDEFGRSIYPWRLCSVQQVEQLKLLLGILPVWVTGVGCFLAMDQMSTLGIMQAIQCDNRIGNFKIPPAWMGLVSMICLSIWIFIYEQVYLPIAKRTTIKDKRMTMRQRINTGIVMAILCMIVAIIMERKRRGLALKHGSFASPLSVFALSPQFALSGLIEAFAAIAVMEFLTTHLPESMRTIAGAVFFLSLSATNYLNAALVNLIHSITAGNGHRPWLGGRDLNQVRIDNYFFLIAALMVVNLLYFNFFSCHYLKLGAQKNSGSVDEEVGLGNRQGEQA
ncbi:Protein NRT1/ PTR FAMILY 2.8 [Linum grandiflorum]